MLRSWLGWRPFPGKKRVEEAATFGYPRERSFLNSGSKTFGYPRQAP